MMQGDIQRNTGEFKGIQEKVNNTGEYIDQSKCVQNITSYLSQKICGVAAPKTRITWVSFLGLDEHSLKILRSSKLLRLNSSPVSNSWYFEISHPCHAIQIYVPMYIVYIIMLQQPIKLIERSPTQSPLYEQHTHCTCLQYGHSPRIVLKVILLSGLVLIHWVGRRGTWWRAWVC